MAKMTMAAARVNAGKTQAEAAKEMGVAVNTVSRWERGESYPSGRRLNGIEACYGVSLNDIIFLPANNA